MRTNDNFTNNPSKSFWKQPINLHKTMTALFIILVVLWSCLGLLYWMWDSAAHIDDRARSEDPLPTWIILVSGPLVWLLYGLLLCVLVLLCVYVRLFGKN